MRRDPSTDAPNFFGFARDYLHTYMPTVRGLSPRTIEAYRISLECFLGYLADHENVEREHVSFDHFDRRHLKAWLAWMVDDRHYASKTIALRLSAVKAFLDYTSHEDVTLVALSQSAKTLRSRASPRKPIEYLTEPETRAILAAFTGRTAKSCRNRMLLILLYDTAARVSEITGLTLGNVSLAKPGHVTLTGKRHKTRVVPLTDKTIEHLHVYLAEFHPNPTRQPATRPMFYSLRRGQPVSRHALGRAQTSRPHRPHGLSHDTRKHPLPHAPQDQSHGPLPTGRAATHHHAASRPRERFDHRSVLRLRNHGHDARSPKRSHARHQYPATPRAHRKQATSPLQPPIAPSR
jgi:integrase/recombinase XerD